MNVRGLGLNPLALLNCSSGGLGVDGVNLVIVVHARLEVLWPDNINGVAEARASTSLNDYDTGRKYK